MAPPQAWALDDAAARVRREKVDEVWSVDTVRDAGILGRYWLAHPMVRLRVNTLASGRPEVDAYGRLAELLGQRDWSLPVGRAVSLGCGFGGLERDLARRGLVRNMLGLDLAAGAVAEARRLAEVEGWATIRYQVSDLESAALPAGSADVVFAHQAIHHIEALDALFHSVRRALRAGGVLHMHEFVGPARFQWTSVQLDLANQFLESLPPRLRRMPSGAPKPRLARPTIAAMIAADPTEAIRSAEIPKIVRRHFDIIEERRLGGTLLHIALGDIAQNFNPADPEANAALEGLFALEDEAMAEGRIGSDFLTLTAVPRRETLGARFRRMAGGVMATALQPRSAALTDAEEDIAFDEAWYLDAYPDVRDAVANGAFASGHEHWLKFGRAEGRQPSGAA